jgi:KDO2-lipid IV(A) lauroyltransferase
MIAAIKRGAVLGVLVDQDTKVESVFVPFFGRAAKTPAAAAELAVRFALPVVAGFIRRNADGFGHSIALEEVSLAGLDALAKDAKVVEATARITAKIELAVRAAPDEWVWFHDRWKSSERVLLE